MARHFTGCAAAALKPAPISADSIRVGPLRKIAAIVLFAVLLIPSARYAWRNRYMPQLGRGHDDAIQYTVAKSLAEGGGYRIPNLPEAPYETKYPPVLVWLLSIPWLLNPRFPGNLPIATALQWTILPLFLIVAERWLRRVGLPPVWRWMALAVLACSPYTALFGAAISTEVLFTVFLLASLLLVETAREQENGTCAALAAGVLAGLAYLTRTAGIVAVVSTPLVFLAWRRRREALSFLAGMLPAVALWTGWVALHRLKTTDLVGIYNTDYLGFFLKDVHLSDVGAVAWKNLAHFLYAMGGILFPAETGGFFEEILRITIAAGIIHALVRNGKNRVAQPYLAFAVLTAAELIVWDFPPNLRFMYPLLPLLLAGLMWEAQFFTDLIRGASADARSSQRIAAWTLGAAGLVLAAAGAWTTLSATLRDLPQMVRDNERIRDENAAAFRWIALHSPAGATILSRNPALYLYAGRRTETLLFMPIHWYRQDSEQLDPLRNLPAYCSSRGLAWITLHASDYEAMTPGSGEAARRLVESNPALRPVYRFGDAVVYQVKGQGPFEQDAHLPRP